MDYINKKIVLDNGKSYLVIEQLNYENNIYIYIANPDNEDDTKFVEIKDGNLLPIDSKLFDEKIFPLFYEKIKQ